jgi:DNA-binding CsgD family transcriptional regulator/ArsR family metal-binding transcriptional regulator
MLVRGVSEVSVSRSGVRNDRVCDLNWGAYFRLDADVRGIFPYINGTAERARYHDRPLHVQFDHDGILCTLYPTEAMAAPFRGRDHAYEFIEDLLAYINDLHDRRRQLTPSHRLHRQPPSIVDIVKALPRTNCRDCGHPTCMAFAVALRNGEAGTGDCPGFADPIAVATVYPVLGKDGTIESTFSIETPAAPLEAPDDALKRKGDTPDPPHSGASDQGSALYDRFGIRIQNHLTPRELEVLRLVAEGASNPEISDQLNISPHTVKSHVIHIFNKLNVGDRTQAAVWAVRNRIV